LADAKVGKEHKKVEMEVVKDPLAASASNSVKASPMSEFMMPNGLDDEDF
jgi:hypothetical protein